MPIKFTCLASASARRVVLGALLAALSAAASANDDTRAAGALAGLIEVHGNSRHHAPRIRPFFDGRAHHGRAHRPRGGHAPMRRFWRGGHRRMPNNCRLVKRSYIDRFGYRRSHLEQICDTPQSFQGGRRRR